MHQKYKKEKEKSCAVDDSDNRRPERALDVDLKITLSQNFLSKYVLLKKVIMHATTAKMIVTARYMHIWKNV